MSEEEKREYYARKEKELEVPNYVSLAHQTAIRNALFRPAEAKLGHYQVYLQLVFIFISNREETGHLTNSVYQNPAALWQISLK